MPTESPKQTGDNYRLPKNIVMIIAIIAIGVAAGFTIASTKNTNRPSMEPTPNEPQSFLDYSSMKPKLDTDEEADEEEADEEESEDEDSTDKNLSEDKAPMGAVGQQPPYMPGQMPAAGSNDQTTQIILFGVEAIAAALLIIYLLMSGFNKKSFKETLKTSDKALVFILSSIVLSVAFCMSSR